MLPEKTSVDKFFHTLFGGHDHIVAGDRFETKPELMGNIVERSTTHGLPLYTINPIHPSIDFGWSYDPKKYEPNNVKSLVYIAINQNQNLKKVFDGELKSWPLYSTPSILPSSNNKVFYIGDAFNGFLPTLAQGAGQSIESAYELFNLLKEESSDVQNSYFQERSKKAKIVKTRTNLNFFVFHFSSSFMQIIRNFFMKFLLKRKSFIKAYLGTVYKS